MAGAQPQEVALSSSDQGRWLGWAGPAATFALALVFFGVLFARFPVLYDTDSYYHLAIARAYLRHGIIDSLPWAQLSLLHEFGDKEVLFHLLLAPLADTTEATAGGRFALALLNALVAGGIAFLGVRAAGRWGLAAAPLLYLGSLDFLSRMIRLRPEILSLLLLLAVTWCAARGRYRWLALLSALYTLGYTAFHALLGLCFAWFVQQWWARGRRPWGLVLYPLLGVGLGLVLHPHFPQNLVVWKVQSLDFFQHKGALNVGGEIGPQSTRDLLTENLAWWLGLAVFWRSAIRGSATRRSAPGRAKPSQGAESDEPMADYLLVSAALFGVLYLLMQRFSIYFLPFATLALLFELRRRGAALGPWTSLPWKGRVPLVLALALVLGLGVPRAADFLTNLARSRSDLTREQEWAAFGDALPPGVRVAAEWGSTHLYMFWAPQATFLNVLDPVFMAVRYPQAYRALRAVFEGREPDVPRALKAELGSDYVALSRFHRPSRLQDRLVADPRLREVHRAFTLLYEVVPGANRDFVLDWRIVPEGRRLPPAAGDVAAFAPYRRAESAELRAVEGYVDAARLVDDPGDCLALVHPMAVAEATVRTWELAPYGPSKIWLDDRLLLAIDQAPGAVLGRGVKIPVALEPGEHRITVLTCPGADQRSGFYLLAR